MSKQISKREAQSVLAAVIAKYKPTLNYYDYPKLYEPGFHANGWTVAWDGGPEDWVFQEYQVPGIFLEPINHWCLGIYQDY